MYGVDLDIIILCDRLIHQEYSYILIDVKDKKNVTAFSLFLQLT